MSAHPAAEPSIESLFRRWREHDDAEALAEVLARTEGELHVVARRQARDDSAAWDLVQESWLTVLREAHRWDANQRLMPWIVGILQIEARRARRDAARVPDPRRLDEPVQRAADAEAPAAEVRAVVSSAVEQLPDLYREVLAMHLLEDLSHTEIARRTGREPGTVRVQVFRGLAQLRKLVPASLALGSALAILAPRSSAAHLAPVLDGAVRIGSGAATVVAAKTAGGASVGAGTAWWFGAVALALVATGAWIATHSDGTDESASIAPPTNVAAIEAGPTEDAGPALAAPRAAARVAVEAPPPAAEPDVARGVRLDVRVDGLARLQPAAPTVTVRANGVTPLVFPVEARERFVLDVSGWYASNGPAPREFVVQYDHPNALSESRPVLFDADQLASARAAAAGRVADPHVIELAFTVRAPIARVHGTVRWADDVSADDRSPSSAALFEIDPAGVIGEHPVEAVDLHGDGTFSLRAPRAGRHALVAFSHGGRARPAGVVLALEPGEQRDAGALEITAGERVTGVVEFDAAEPRTVLAPAVRWRVADAARIVSVRGHALAWIDGRFELSGGTVACDRDGAFAIEGLARLGYELESTYRVASGGSSTIDVAPAFSRALRVAAPNSGLALEVPAVTRVVVTSDGSALDGARVSFVARGARVGVEGRTDGSGRVRLVGAGAGSLRVAATDHATHERLLDERHEAEIDVRLAKSADRGGVALVAPGIAWSGASCRFVRTSELAPDALATLRDGGWPQGLAAVAREVDAEGRVTEGLPEGRWIVRVEGRRDADDPVLAHARPFVTEIEVRPGITTRVEVAFELAGRIRFAPVRAREGARDVALELVGPDGAVLPLAITSVVLRGDARQGRVTTTDSLPFGANGTSAPLAPGRHVVTARVGDATVVRTVDVEAGRTAVVELDG